MDNQNNNTHTEERTFTQDEVNRIVSERLERERNKTTETNTLSEREKELAKRENRMTCAERLSEENISKDLLDILDTSDPDKFMENVEKLGSMGLNGASDNPVPKVVSVTPGPAYLESDSDLRSAFGLDRKEG